MSEVFNESSEQTGGIQRGSVVLTGSVYQHSRGDTAPKIQFIGQVILIWPYETEVGICVSWVRKYPHD